MSNDIPVITVDGPSGSGKGTVSQLLAQKLNWHLLDSGALYRVLALAAQNQQIPAENEPALEKLAHELAVSFHITDDKSTSVYLENKDVTDLIRTEIMGNAASKISKYATIRQALLKRQRAFQQLPGLVADGRDMGTIVFPEAPVKFFLFASAEERAMRRYKQLKAKGIDVTLASLVTEIEQRDKRDRERSVAPLKPANDAVMIDTTGLSIKEVMQRVWQEVANKLHLAVVEKD